MKNSSFILSLLMSFTVLTACGGGNGALPITSVPLDDGGGDEEIQVAAVVREKVLVVEALREEKVMVAVTEEPYIQQHGRDVKTIIDNTEQFEGVLVEGNIDNEAYWQYIDDVIKKEKIRF